VSGDHRRRVRFAAGVADCRARVDALIAESGDQRLLARRVDALLEAVVDTIRCGPDDEARLLAPLADAMEDAAESLRTLGGLADPRVFAVLRRSVALLESGGRRRGAIAEANSLRAALAGAVSDTAWRDHSRRTWTASSEDPDAQIAHSGSQ
jgi:hypothetical protein